MENKNILNYTLKHPLGKGGMAEVWYAENEIGNVAAVKILNEDLSHNAQIVERFRNEAKVTVKLKHPNIRQVYDYAVLDGRPCMVMEYLEGEDLSSRMKSGEQFTDEQLRKWWDQLASALNYTHQHGVVHRDIKPSNIFINLEGDVKLLDFGIAKIQEGITLTQTGATMGTLMYMSPEQVEDSKHIDIQTDLYSLAVSFVHLLQGHAPYDTSTTSDYQIRKRIVEIPLDLHEIPTGWQNFLQPYLAKNPMERPALTAFNEAAPAMPQPPRSAQAPEETFVGNAPTLPATDDEGTVAGTTETLLSQQPAIQQTEISTPAPKKPKKKRKGLVIGLVIGALALAGGGIAAWLLTSPKQNEKQVDESPTGGHAAEFFNLRGHVKSVKEERDHGNEEYSNYFFEFDKEGYLIQGEERERGEGPIYWTYDKEKDQLICKENDKEMCRILPIRGINHNGGLPCGAYLLGNLFWGDDAQLFTDEETSNYAKKYPIYFDEQWSITKGEKDDFIYEMQSNDKLSLSVFQYDERGNLTKFENSTVENGDTLHSTVTYSYDSQNRITNSCEKFGVTNTMKVSYNEQGDVAKIVQERDGERNTISFSYEYDKQGNWTSRTMVGSDETMKSTRVIEYY